MSPPAELRTPTDAFTDIVDASSSSGHTLIARGDGSVWSTGANDRGQLGLGFSGEPLESLTQVPGLADVVKVVASGASSYAIDSRGQLWVWGDDSAGQLGIGRPAGAMAQLTPALNSFALVVDIDAGTDFAIAAGIDGAIWSWGANAESQLGAAGPDRNVPGRVDAPQDFFAIDVAAGGSTALARARGGDVMGWGGNGWRQIADAGATIGAGTTIVTRGASAIAAGDGHIVVALVDGTVQVRGANWAGQLGNATQLPTSGLQTVAGLSGVIDVAAGAAHSVAVMNDGRAFAWGFNHKRQLLLPTPDVFTATPAQVLDVPRTARSVRAKSETTILLSDPGALAIHSSVPPTVACAQPFAAALSIDGFNASGGEPDQNFPGIQNLTMTLTVTPAFELAGPVTADTGIVTSIGRSITWSVATLGASRATLDVPLRATGVAGEFPVFNAVSYSSSFEPAPTDVASPTISLPGCVRPDTTPPMIATVAANPATLAPPNHQMIPVSVSVSATDDTSLPACAIAGVTSNEASSPGESDWMITGPLTMRLRSERDAHGTGRIYSIRVRCVDAAGNAASALTTVSVPKSQKK